MDLAEWRWSDAQSPVGGEATGANPTDRGQQGTTRRVRTDGQGSPLAGVGAGAKRHDRKLWAATLEAVVRERPAPTDDTPPHWCADQGDDSAACRDEAARQASIAHSRSRGEARQEKQAIPGYRARRWVVEVCHAWLQRFRKILVRFEKKLATHRALLQFACAYMVLKRADVFR